MTTPGAIFETSLRMMPRLEAEESILAVNRAAVAAGTMDPSARARLTARWERQALPQPVEPQTANQARPLPHLGLGLELEEVPPRGE